MKPWKSQSESKTRGRIQKMIFFLFILGMVEPMLILRPPRKSTRLLHRLVKLALGASTSCLFLFACLICLVARMGAVLSDKYSNWRERLNDILDKEDGKEKGASDEDQKKDTRREKEEKGASSEKEEEEGEMKDGPRDEEKDVSSEETPKENGLNEETPMDTQEDEPAAAPPPSPPEEPATYESMKIKGNQFVREVRKRRQYFMRGPPLWL